MNYHSSVTLHKELIEVPSEENCIPYSSICVKEIQASGVGKMCHKIDFV